MGLTIISELGLWIVCNAFHDYLFHGRYMAIIILIEVYY